MIWKLTVFAGPGQMIQALFTSRAAAEASARISFPGKRMALEEVEVYSSPIDLTKE